MVRHTPETALGAVVSGILISLMLAVLAAVGVPPVLPALRAVLAGVR